MKYIIGLGNPMDEYKGTRHNVGADFLYELFGESNFEKQGHLNSLVAKDSSSDAVVILPQAFMNLSGQSVSKIDNIEKVLEDGENEIIVVHDDIDLPFGNIKFSFDSGAGGHNGVKSIIDSLGTQKFARLRIGILPVIDGVIRKPVGEDAVANFVLKRFNAEEREKLEKETLPNAKEALKVWLEKGFNTASNKYN